MKAFNKLNRNYKDSLPEETIDKIEGILYRCKIDIDKKSWAKFIKGVYSLRIESTNPPFGTNGKGRNRKYALASAYAEYIERLQNDLLLLGHPMRKFLLDKIKIKTGYYYYPDEVVLSYDDFIKMPEVLIRELMNFEFQINNEKILELFADKDGIKKTLIAVPFYSVSSDSLIYIPLNMMFSLIGSTGMAAGNTIEEAIFQSLCEIIERYAAAQIYFNRLTPPTIFKEYLRKYPEEYKIIEEIETLGFHVEIRDFSCGMELPAIGIIVYDNTKSRYRLNVGADTSIQVALSRCLTEILQGFESKEEWLGKFIPVPMEEFSYFLSDDEKSLKVREREFENFTINGNGVFPYSLFMKNLSYSFNKNTFHTQKNYKEEIIVLKRKFDQLGSELFIRDVSFLGFPSVYIYATNISLIARKSQEPSINDFGLAASYNMQDIDMLLNNKQNYLAPDFIDRIVDIFPYEKIKIEKARVEDIFRLKFSSDHIMSKLPISYLFFLNCFHNKHYDSALRYFDLAMSILKVKGNTYFDGLRNYIKAFTNGIPEEASEYNEMLKKNPFENLDLPICPHCNKCSLKKYCETNLCVNSHIRIIKKMSSNRLEQISIRSYFTL